ncbi:MAG: biotin/lipoyl-containing protein [Bacteriovoracaceae bacterium]
MKRKINLNGEMTEFESIDLGAHIQIKVDGKEFLFQKKASAEDQIVLSLNQLNFKGEVANLGSVTQVFAGDLEAMLEVPKSKSKSLDHGIGPISPMPGKVFKVLVKNGDRVKKGDALMILEAMKMEHTIKANVEGEVKKVFFKEGEMVTGGVTLVEIGK